MFERRAASFGDVGAEALGSFVWRSSFASTDFLLPSLEGHFATPVGK
jgi:hypothetical protein